MAKALLVTGIELLPIPEPMPPGVVTDKALDVTNDHKYVAGLLSDPFRRYAGQMETDFLTRDATLVAYWLAEIDGTEPPERFHELLLGWLIRVRRLLQALWLVKDNAACVELGFVEAPHAAVPTIIWRNFWQGVISKADSTRDATPFTRTEFQDAWSMFARIMDQLESEIAAGGPRHSRWNTALYFLDVARLAHNPGVKIAQYCTCLEALFATDAQELSHKLAERVACFLEDNPTDRLRMFGEIKAAYTLRSKIVHGQTKAIDKGLEAQVVAIQCDNALRRILVRILADADLSRRFIQGHDKGSEEYFNSLVLGGTP